MINIGDYVIYKSHTVYRRRFHTKHFESVYIPISYHVRNSKLRQVLYSTTELFYGSALCIRSMD